MLNKIFDYFVPSRHPGGNWVAQLSNAAPGVVPLTLTAFRAMMSTRYRSYCFPSTSRHSDPGLACAIGQHARHQAPKKPDRNRKERVDL
jgi:hypothetical protein